MSTGLVVGILSFAPAFGVVYWVLGAQEDFFEHKAMVLALIGGLVLGILAAIPEMFVLVDAGVLLVIPMFALIETMGKTMLLGLGRFRDNPQTILLGGAAGATMAGMLMMFYVQTILDQPLTATLIAKVALAAIGFTGAHFISGMRLGEGPAKGSVVSGFLPSLAWLLPAHVFLGLLGMILIEGQVIVQPLAGDWIWSVPLAVYGAAIFVWKTPDLVRKGLPQAERRRIRREQRNKRS